MPRPKGPDRQKAILLRLTDQEHRLANALAIACGTTVQSALLDLLHQGAKALRVSVPEHVPENQLALAFRKQRTLRGPSGGMGTRGMGSGKKTRRKSPAKRKAAKRAKSPATAKAA